MMASQNKVNPPIKGQWQQECWINHYKIEGINNLGISIYHVSNMTKTTTSLTTNICVHKFIWPHSVFHEWRMFVDSFFLLLQRADHAEIWVVPPALPSSAPWSGPSLLSFTFLTTSSSSMLWATCSPLWQCCSPTLSSWPQLCSLE